MSLIPTPDKTYWVVISKFSEPIEGSFVRRDEAGDWYRVTPNVNAVALFASESYEACLEWSKT